MKDTILVVGGAGYIGSHTVKHLFNNCYKVVVADNLSTGTEKAVKNATFVKADILDKSSLHNIFNTYKINAVIHFAAAIQVGESVSNPEKYYFNNVNGTLNLLEVMMHYGVKKLIFSSSAATYGNPEYLPIDEKHPQCPINPYGQTKLIIEKVLADYARAYSLKYIALRYFNAAGCDSDGELGSTIALNLLPIIMEVLVGKRDVLRVFGQDYDTHDGTCLRDYVHVEDLAVAHRLALENLDKFSGCINLGNNNPVSVREIITATEKVTGKKLPVEYVARRLGDPAMLYALSDKAKSILGWTAKYKNIEDIIKTAWHWEQNRKF